MSCPLLLKVLATPGAAPAAANVLVREIAIDTTNAILYTKKVNGTVVPLNPPVPRYVKRLQTNSSGQIAVTFPAGLFTSPVVNTTVETPTADQSNYTYKTEIISAPTATGCTIKVTRQATSVTILALGTIVLAQAAPAGVYVNVQAFEST